MKTETPDALVIGLGAMGSATAYQLAKRGAKVVGVDRFAPPHAHGSTHGETRITREAIGEGAQFVPLAMRSHKLWREIEGETGETLLTTCGGLVIARTGQQSWMHEQRDFFGNTVRAAQTFGIAHERLSANEIAARFPQFALQGDECGYFEPGAGYLAPEACVRAQLSLAARHGAELHTGETVQTVTHANGQTTVETDRARYRSGVTIVCAGPWMPQLLPRMAASLAVRRQVLYWFERVPTDTAIASSREKPIFIWHWGDGADDVFYGFPEIDNGGAIKVATEQCETSTTPETVNREVTKDEIAAMHARHVAGRLRGVSARCAKAVTCLYTSTQGANFIIDRLPDAPDTIVVSACSGHGFKHSAAIGEAVATMAMTDDVYEVPDVLKPFALRREA
jgi:sarcosine oxidase